MTVFVLRHGELVEKVTPVDAELRFCDFPSPRVSRFSGYESPIDGHWISSDRQRERDLAANDAYDPRDVSAAPRRGRDNQLREKADADRTRREARATDLWGKWPNTTVGPTEEPA